MIKHYKEEIPLFEKFAIEGQIEEVYRERVFLKSGGHLFIKPTEAMITIDVNSGKGTSRKDVEDTAYRTNLEAAEEIARQLRLRDLGGLVVIDFIDMEDRKHVAQIEKAFKNALSIDRSRIQLSKISRFGMLELTRQKKQSTSRRSAMSSAPTARARESALPGVACPSDLQEDQGGVGERHLRHHQGASTPEVSDYLLNQKRSELAKLETLYQTGSNSGGATTFLGGFRTGDRKKGTGGIAGTLPGDGKGGEGKAARKEKEREREKEKGKEKEKEKEKGKEKEQEKEQEKAAEGNRRLRRKAGRGGEGDGARRNPPRPSRARPSREASKERKRRPWRYRKAAKGPSRHPGGAGQL
jgi:ribonuclease E